MTPEARAFIIKQFCRQVSAVDVAYLANSLFTLEWKVTAEAVQNIWREERETNVVLRELESKLGERPVKGFVPCEHARLAERLAAV